MYYEQNQLAEILSCGFCKEKFSSTIKLIPCCGTSICTKCHQAVDQEIQIGNKFACKTCMQDHDTPQNGFPDNANLMRLLNVQPRKKDLTPKDMRLKHVLDTVQEKLASIKSFNYHEEIELQCHNLQGQVIEAVESAIHHFKKLEQEYLARIISHREKLELILESGEVFKLDEYQETKLKRVEEFLGKWDEYFGNAQKTANEKELEEAERDAKRLRAKLEKIHQYMKDQLTYSLLIFRANEELLEDEEILGQFIEINTIDLDPILFSNSRARDSTLHAPPVRNGNKGIDVMVSEAIGIDNNDIKKNQPANSKPDSSLFEVPFIINLQAKIDELCEIMGNETDEIKKKKEILKMNPQKHSDKSYIAMLLHEIGVLYDLQGLCTEAIKYHLESVKMYKRIHKEHSANKDVARGLFFLADSLYKNGQNMLALDFCHGTLEICENITRNQNRPESYIRPKVENLLSKIKPPKQ